MPFTPETRVGINTVNPNNTLSVNGGVSILNGNKHTPADTSLDQCNRPGHLGKTKSTPITVLAG